MVKQCKRCDLAEACANRDPDDIITRFRNDFDKDDYDFYNDPEDVEMYAEMIFKCTGYYCPFKNEDIKSLQIMMSYSLPREIWISDKENPGIETVFYQVVF